MHNIAILNEMLTGPRRQILPHGAQSSVLDIGAADGDLGYFFESVGARVDVIDHPPK